MAKDFHVVPGAVPAGGTDGPPLAGPAASRELAIAWGPAPAFHAPAIAQLSQVFFWRRDSRRVQGFASCYQLPCGWSMLSV
ncbi:hypothetical protein PAL_GLEAN10016395 [Pteropus alecto]|uniref:Uncharacterized protein n=1 Tax=Pteropus alecto TaxID=9402 RepID=L5JNR9_PTEAL|nr:hypothetical protein PAL_GLEAN10016395 [Pteropus alecto]